MHKIRKYNVIIMIKDNLRKLNEQQLLLLIEDHQFNLNMIEDY